MIQGHMLILSLWLTDQACYLNRWAADLSRRPNAAISQLSMCYTCAIRANLHPVHTCPWVGQQPALFGCQNFVSLLVLARLKLRDTLCCAEYEHQARAHPSSTGRSAGAQQQDTAGPAAAVAVSPGTCPQGTACPGTLCLWSVHNQPYRVVLCSAELFRYNIGNA